MRQCHQCQIHGNLNHLPPTVLNSLSSPWPFAAWEIDIIGEIRPNALNGHKYIVVAIDYFSRWIEAESFGTLTAKHMEKFIENSLISRYKVPHHIMTDNGVQFQAEKAELLQRYGIEHHKFSPYRPQANGAVKAANKNIKQILSKMVKFIEKSVIYRYGVPHHIVTDNGVQFQAETAELL